jgi:hypothetical protein
MSPELKVTMYDCAPLYTVSCTENGSVLFKNLAAAAAASWGEMSA